MSPWVFSGRWQSAASSMASGDIQGTQAAMMPRAIILAHFTSPNVSTALSVMGKTYVRAPGGDTASFIYVLSASNTPPGFTVEANCPQDSWDMHSTRSGSVTS